MPQVTRPHVVFNCTSTSFINGCHFVEAILWELNHQALSHQGPSLMRAAMCCLQINILRETFSIVKLTVVFKWPCQDSLLTQNMLVVGAFSYLVEVWILIPHERCLELLNKTCKKFISYSCRLMYLLPLSFMYVPISGLNCSDLCWGEAHSLTNQFEIHVLSFLRTEPLTTFSGIVWMKWRFMPEKVFILCYQWCTRRYSLMQSIHKSSRLLRERECLPWSRVRGMFLHVFIVLSHSLALIPPQPLFANHQRLYNITKSRLSAPDSLKLIIKRIGQKFDEHLKTLGKSGM